MPLPKLNNPLVSKSCSRFCAIDLQMSFLALAIASKKYKTISETCAMWLRFGAVCETQGLAFLNQLGSRHQTFSLNVSSLETFSEEEEAARFRLKISDFWL